MNIRDLLLELVKGQNLYSQLAKVDAVDKSALTCDVSPINGDAKIFDVLLQTGKGKGWVAYPKKGSVVMVTMVSKDSGFVSMLSDVEKFSLETQNESLKKILSDLLDAIAQLTVTCAAPGSPSAPPVNMAAFTQIKTRLDNLLDK